MIVVTDCMQFIPVMGLFLWTLFMDLDKIATQNREGIHLSSLKNLARFEVGKLVFLTFKVENPFFVFVVFLNFSRICD